MFVRGAWVLLLAASSASALALPREAPLPGDYRIENGRVDAGTYNGWRLFHSACHGCHGTGGVGTDVAPDLVERIKTMTPRGFAAKVLTSYRLVPLDGNGEAAHDRLLEEVMKRDRRARGQVLMPAWEGSERVPVHVLDLYAYLNARADGELGPGRPQRIAAPAKPRRR
jgi:mono/diheme cytochrome c family protein